MSNEIILAFITYFSILLIIGLSAHRSQSTDADFILGNRSLNFWLTALSAHASDMSAWLFMAFPAALFTGGIPQIWVAVGLVLGMFLNWQIVAPRLRVETERLNSYTLPTFFERRFHDHSGTIRLLTASVTVLFLTSYLSAGLIAMGLLFESLFGIDYYIGITVATLVAMTYTFVGGFITVAWTDLFQAIFLLVAILIVPLFALGHMEGLQTVQKIAAQKEIPLTLLPEVSLGAFFNIVMLIASWGLGYFGQPHIATKFMGIKSADELYKSKYLGVSWQILALAAAAFVGIVGIGFFPQGLENAELVFVDMVKSLFHPYVGGLILCGIIAANMSTMDSQMLVCASVLTEDFYKRIKKQTPTPKTLLTVSRTFVVVVALTALFLAYDKSSTVLEVVFYAWSGLGSAFGPLVLVSLYGGRYVNLYGAVVGILVGGLMVIGLWDWLQGFWGGEVPSLIPGFMLSLLSIFLVSYLSYDKPKSPAGK